VTNSQTQTRITNDSDHGPRPSALETAKLALEAALDKKAIEPVLLDVGAMCSYTEHILLLSGRSDRQVDAIAGAVAEAVKATGRRALGVEGVKSGQWALLDFGDLVVHVFLHSTRTHYDLESLWVEAPRVAIDVPAEARASADDIY
jgi:ribosome-associated protein